MSGLPTFLNPLTALLAAGMVVPPLLLLYFLKLRRREQQVASTLLWRKAIVDLQVNAPFQRLRRNLLLLLQLLLLLLLCLALARPVVHYTPSPGKNTVILIDHSASMSAVETFGAANTSRLEEAKRQARNLVDAMGKDDRAMVISCDDSAQIELPFTTDPQRLKTAINAIEPTDRASRLKTAYKLADAQTAFNPEQLRSGEMDLPNVYLFSDGRVLDAGELRLRGNLFFTPIGSSDLPNVAVVALSAKRNYERPAEVQAFARLANYGPDPVEADVELRVNGEVRGEATGELGCFLYPERWDQAQRDNYQKIPGHLPHKNSVTFPKIEIFSAAVISVRQIPRGPDALAADDIAYVVVPPPKSLSVLLVTDGDYFVEKAINSMSLKHPDILSPAAYEDDPKLGHPITYDVIIFDRYQPRWLPPVGNFMHFGSIPDGLPVVAVKEQGQNVMLSRPGVLDWERDHPILRGLMLNRLFINEAIKFQIPLPAAVQVLMQGYKGPLMVLCRQDRCTHLLVGFDVVNQSDWPMRLSFPVFMHNALEFLALGADMDVRLSYAPGSTPRIPRVNLQQAGVPDRIRQIKLDGPMGRKTLTVSEEGGDFVLPALDKVGVYSLDPPIPQFEKIAVSLLDANESNLMPQTLAPGGIGQTATGRGKAPWELWWWIIAAAGLPLLMIEWWIYTRRMHL